MSATLPVAGDAPPRPTGRSLVEVLGALGTPTTVDLLERVLAADGARYVVRAAGAATALSAPFAVVVLSDGLAGPADGAPGAVRAAITRAAVAVLDADDPAVATLAGAAVGPVVTFGTTPGAQVRAVDVRLDGAGACVFTLLADLPGRPALRTEVRLRLVGEHHVRSALGAAALGLAVGIDAARVAQALGTVDAGSSHRLRVVHRRDGVTVIDDTADADPDSVRVALKALAVLSRPDRRSVAVLGEMSGPAQRSAYDAIGRIVVRLDVGLTVVVGATARPIADGAAHEGSWGDEVAIVDDPGTATAFLDHELTPGDVVLVTGAPGSGLAALVDHLIDDRVRPHPGARS